MEPPRPRRMSPGLPAAEDASAMSPTVASKRLRKDPALPSDQVNYIMLKRL
jgi:hypothetical protein